MIFKRLGILICFLVPSSIVYPQDFKKQFEAFKESAQKNYNSFRDECNQKYADFLRTAWDWYEGKSPLPIPKENPVPPRPYKPIDENPVIVKPTPVKPIEPKPQPKPISPIRENPNPAEVSFPVTFFGITSEIRLPEVSEIALQGISPNELGNAWESLSNIGMNNTIRDCLETRIRYNFCDWAYLNFIRNLASQYVSDENTATLLAAFLYCQSGYQMRLADDNGKLAMLIGSDHYIYEKPYFIIDGRPFYTFGNVSNQLKICNATFEGETPLSLYINDEQLLGEDLSEAREIKSQRFPAVVAASKVPVELIKFYNDYPTSMASNNPLTRWAIYAETPIAEKTKAQLYPALKKSIEGDSPIEAANKLLNWVQTGFVYEYDDKVWGTDRAFFAEETLYYPYADCEDRAILFSRLARDLLDLDVALIYYPGHMATAVKFDSEIVGDTMIIDGEKFIVCDPTYIGAPVGKQMPGLDYDNVEAILLKR